MTLWSLMLPDLKNSISSDHALSRCSSEQIFRTTEGSVVMALMYGVSLWSFLYLLFGFTPMNKHKCPAITLHKHPLIKEVDYSPQDRFVCKKLWVSPRSGPRPKLDSSFSGRGMIVSPSPTLARIPQRVMSR